MGKIAQGALVYLDANVLIYLTEGTVAHRTSVAAKLRPFEAAACRFTTSELTLAEVLVHPIRADDDALIAVYEKLFDDFVRPEPITREVLYLAAQLRANTPGQRMPDAIHVATAILLDAGVFASGDRGIRNLPAAMQQVVV
jgi:predicted nucleic acid-binding protein